MELMTANREWATRPADERVQTIGELYAKAKAFAATAVERPDVRVSTLRTEAKDGNVELVGKGNVGAKLTHWAFGQLARYVGAPADYLRDLPATLATQNLNHGLAKRVQDGVANLLLHSADRGQSFMLRALTSERYARIWNWEVAERLLDLESKGWKPATPTFRGMEDETSTAIYISDHDMFSFICHPDRVIREQGNDRGLLRGLIAVNSEVGASSIKLMRFLYREMCGNHIIWGAEDVVELKARHIGNVRDRFSLWKAQITEYLNESTTEDERKVKRAQTSIIAATKEEVLDALFGKKTLGLSRKALDAGYDAVKPEEDGAANSVWGLAQGLTRYSQTIPYADGRTAIDTAAGKLISMAF